MESIARVWAARAALEQVPAQVDLWWVASVEVIDLWRCEMIKKVVEFVADVVGLVVAVIGITIFGIAFS